MFLFDLELATADLVALVAPATQVRELISLSNLCTYPSLSSEVVSHSPQSVLIWPAFVGSSFRWKSEWHPKARQIWHFLRSFFFSSSERDLKAFNFASHAVLDNCGSGLSRGTGLRSLWEVTWLVAILVLAGLLL